MNTEHMNISFAALAARLKVVEGDNALMQAALDALKPDWRTPKGESGTMTAKEDERKAIGYVTPKGDYANIRQYPTVVSEANPVISEIREWFPALSRVQGEYGYWWYEIPLGGYVREDVVTFTPDKPAPATPIDAALWPSPAPIEGPYTVTGRHNINDHKGVDLATMDQTPIVWGRDNGYVVKVSPCPKCGPIGTPRVRVPSNNYGYGNFLIVSYALDTTNPNTTYLHCLYAHLSSITVSAGQTLFGRQRIGVVGSTGDSTGDHLHLECRVGAARDTRWAEMQNHEINPALFFAL